MAEPGRDSECTEFDSSGQLAELLRGLSPEQMRYVARRPFTSTNEEAADLARVPVNTVYSWKKRGAPIDLCVSLMSADGVTMAREILRRQVVRAAEVKATGLSSRSEKMKQDTATEILDRNLGKATQPTDNTHDIKRSGVLEEMLREIREAGPSGEVADS